jgi:hypothetical protein
VEVLRLDLEFLESTFRIDVDGVFGVLADVELCLELLGRLVVSGPLSVLSFCLLGERGTCALLRRRLENGTQCGPGSATYAGNTLLKTPEAHSLAVIRFLKRQNIAVCWQSHRRDVL